MVTDQAAANEASPDRRAPAGVEWQEHPDLRLIASGDWIVTQLSGVTGQLGAHRTERARLDVSHMGEVDTAGAFALVLALRDLVI